MAHLAFAKHSTFAATLVRFGATGALPSCETSLNMSLLLRLPSLVTHPLVEATPHGELWQLPDIYRQARKPLLLYTAYMYARATRQTSNQCAPRSTSAARPRGLATANAILENAADWATNHWFCTDVVLFDARDAVSYTHLTLPTIYSV